VVEIDGIDYESTFGGVIFSASQAQSGEFPTDFAEETIVGGAVSGTSYTYRDFFSNPPDTLDLPILLPDRATLEALAALRAYPVDNGGVPYELHTAQFDWSATLDKLTWSGAYLNGPVQAKATFTKIADLGLTAPTGPTTVTAGYVAGVDGLNVDIDLNFGPGPGGSGGTTSSDGLADDYWITWGDGSPADHVTGGPWSIADAEIPIASHTFAAPSPTGADYVIEVSVNRNSVASDGYATVVTV
jgi:hypothetical protein